MAAALLARRGFKVLVLERQKFPRFSIGESLLACSMELLAEAGMVEAVMARGFPVQERRGLRSQRRVLGIQLRREIEPGLSVHLPGAARGLRRDAGRRGAAPGRRNPLRGRDHRRGFQRRRAQGHQPRRQMAPSKMHEPRFVLDASGFGRTLPKLLGLEQPSAFPPRAAIFTHVRDNTVAGSLRPAEDPRRRASHRIATYGRG